MKPRFEAISYEVKKMLEKAEQLNTRLTLLEKAEDEHKSKITSCLKKKGGAASLEDCAKECGISTDECKKVINSMDNVKMSPHGDVVLTDGLQKGEGKPCPSCKDGKLDKAGMCMKAGCNTKMEKADPLADPKPLPKEKITDVNPHLVTESGGQTKTAYYTTNGNTIEYEDGKPKRDKHDKKVDLGKLGGRMNPHAGTGTEREDAEGGSERRY